MSWLQEYDIWRYAVAILKIDNFLFNLNEALTTEQQHWNLDNS